jgi:hypothetical protein
MVAIKSWFYDEDAGGYLRRKTMEMDDRAEYSASRLDDARRRFHGVEITGKCGKCSHSHIYRTERSNDPVIMCVRNDRPMRMPTDVSDCSKFSPQGRLDIWDLVKMAVPLDLDKKKLGFNKEEE